MEKVKNFKQKLTGHSYGLFICDTYGFYLHMKWMANMSQHLAFEILLDKLDLEGLGNRVLIGPQV